MASYKITLYKHKKLTNDNHPIMIQILHDRIVRRISTGLKCKVDEWNEEAIRFNKNMRNFKQKNSTLIQLEAKLDSIMSEFLSGIRVFSFTYFERMLNKSNKQVTVFNFTDIIIREKEAKGKIGTFKIYADMRRSLHKYKPNESLLFSDIDYNFLVSFENFLFSDGYSNGGISVYMRTLRATINEAIRRQIMPVDLYPFKPKYWRIFHSSFKIQSKS